MSREIFKLHGVIGMDGLRPVMNNLLTLQGQLVKLDRQLGNFGRMATKIGTTFTKYFTAPLVAVGAAVAVAENKTMQYAEQMVKLNEVTGLSTDTLQELKHVAAMTGVDFEAITGAVQKFARQLPEIAKGTGPAYEMLKKLGVNVFDSSGKVRDINKLFFEMMKRIQRIENPMTRLAVEQQIFGRGAGELGPILKMTGEQLDAMRKEAHDTGIVLSGESLRAAEAFGDEVEKLKEQANAMVMKLAMDFIPILRDEILPLIQSKVVPAVRAFAEKIKGVVEWFNELSGTDKMWIGIVAAMGPFLVILGKTIFAVRELATAFRIMKTAFATNPFGVALLGATALVGIMISLNEQFGIAEKAMAALTGYKDKMTNLYNADIKQLERLNEIKKQGPFSYINPEELQRLGVADGKLENIGKRIQTLEKLTGRIKGILKMSPPETRKEGALKSQPLNFEFDESGKEDEWNEKKRLEFWRDLNLEIAEYKGEIVEKQAQIDEEITRKGLAVMRADMDADAQARYEKQQEEVEQTKKYGEKMVGLYMNIGQMVGNAIADGIMDGSEGLKTALKEILKVFLGFIEKMMIQAIFANAMKNVMTLSFPGLLKAAAEAAVITTMFAVAKKGVDSFGEGAFIQGGRGGVVAQIGERRDDEIVLPMRAGIQALADGIITRLGSIAPALPAPAFAGPGGRSAERPIALNIGTLIADDRGIKELERRLGQFRISEAQRRGAD